MIISVSVKMMSGKLVIVSVDPSLGLRGVQDALTASDPEFFPAHRVIVIHSVEGATKITAEEELYGFVKGEPMCQLVEVTNEVIHGTNALYCHTYTHFQLLSEKEEPFHMYVRTDTPTATFQIRKTPFTVGRRCRPHPHDAMVDAPHMGLNLSARDHYVIELILKKFMPHIMYDSPERDIHLLQLLCPCGHPVKQGTINAHYKTKLKHKTGDERGRIFMERANASIDEMEFINLDHLPYIRHKPDNDNMVSIDLDQFALIQAAEIDHMEF